MKGLISCIVSVFLIITAQWSYAMTVKIHYENMDITEVGETIDIQVMVEDSADLGSFQFDLIYDPEILVINDKEDMKIGDFLKGTVLQIPPVVNNTAGKLTFGEISFGQTKGASGSGLLATVTFTVKKPADTVIKINAVKTTDTKGCRLSVETGEEIEITGKELNTEDNI